MRKEVFLEMHNNDGSLPRRPGSDVQVLQLIRMQNYGRYLDWVSALIPVRLAELIQGGDAARGGKGGKVVS